MKPVMALSAALYAWAFLITQLTHELAHALIGWAWGRGPRLGFAMVTYARDLSAEVQVATALAGPLWSLMMGGLCLMLVRRGHLAPPARLLVAWGAYHGWVNAAGYAFTAWFVPAGDVGKAARLLGAGTPSLMAVTALGWGALLVLTRPWVPTIVELSPYDFPDEAAARRWARDVAWGPAWVATPLLALASLPAPQGFTLLYVLTTPLALYDVGAQVAASRASTGRSALTSGWRRAGLVGGGLIVAWVSARVLLDPGVPWGP